MDARNKKRFNKLLINSRVVYWKNMDEKNIDYIGRMLEEQRFTNDKRQKRNLAELLHIVKSFKMTNSEIEKHIADMSNPRAEWRERMRIHDKGGKETRDNKCQAVYGYVNVNPDRDKNGNILMCRKNIIRYPKKCRSRRTWRNFYMMFPNQAKLDNWDGNTSDKMKKAGKLGKKNTD